MIAILRQFLWLMKQDDWNEMSTNSNGNLGIFSFQLWLMRCFVIYSRVLHHQPCWVDRHFVAFFQTTSGLALWRSIREYDLNRFFSFSQFFVKLSSSSTLGGAVWPFYSCDDILDSVTGWMKHSKLFLDSTFDDIAVKIIYSLWDGDWHGHLLPRVTNGTDPIFDFELVFKNGLMIGIILL